MKIGLMAYHSACNFGATLQLFSTYQYLKKQGHQPIVINWIAEDLDSFYQRTTPKIQYTKQKEYRQAFWNETELCRNDSDIAMAIKKNKIEAVIIGSDAVAQHHPFWDRLVFPCRKIIALENYTSDTIFPNPFWATWTDFLDSQIPVVMMSAASQDSQYQYIPSKERRSMHKRLERFQYISVRDATTQKMFETITRKKIIPDVTPDPVFAFEQNAKDKIPTREYILNKYHLKEKYVLVSFVQAKRQRVNQEWLNELQTYIEADEYDCISLPFATSKSYGDLHKEIPLPLNPLEWYALIKYSAGYIGNNMHPIVVCLHNAVPFFCFDNYGTRHFNGLLCNSNTSKIKHILDKANLLEYRVPCNTLFHKVPSAKEIYRKIRNFDKTKSIEFSKFYLDRYNSMMNTIIDTITNYE